MRQRVRTHNLTICYCKKQTGVSFSRACPGIDDEFRHDSVRVVCGYCGHSRMQGQRLPGNNAIRQTRKPTRKVTGSEQDNQPKMQPGNETTTQPQNIQQANQRTRN